MHILYRSMLLCGVLITFCTTAQALYSAIELADSENPILALLQFERANREIIEAAAKRSSWTEERRKEEKCIKDIEDATQAIGADKVTGIIANIYHNNVFSKTWQRRGLDTGKVFEYKALDMIGFITTWQKNCSMTIPQESRLEEAWRTYFFTWILYVDTAYRWLKGETSKNRANHFTGTSRKGLKHLFDIIAPQAKRVDPRFEEFLIQHTHAYNDLVSAFGPE